MSESDEGRFSAGDLFIDMKRRLVTRGNEAISLTWTEWKLLEALAWEAGNAVPFSVLLSQVWGPAYREDLQYLRVRISRLMAKIETDLENPQVISQQSYGYAFHASPSP